MTLRKTTRIILGVASLTLLITYFVPLWQILLWAPQYPEGLTMKIWHNNLSGEVAIINGLNHYIGMKHISVEMFPEFRFIGILIGLLMSVGLLAAVLGSGRILFFFTLLSYIYGIAALWDFWQWGYDYGHNLDPKAAIIVPDMSYQPPLIGYKNLLNFTSYSGPDIGAWIIIGVCFLATVLWWWAFFKNKKKNWTLGVGSDKAGGALLFIILMIPSCSSGPEPIQYGKDSCHFCKMTLMDKRFGAEIVTQKGKIYKFDDLNCLMFFLKSDVLPLDHIAQILSVDFEKPESLVDVKQAFFLQSPALKSPMRGDVATFSTQSELSMVKERVGTGKEIQWDEVKSGF